ncbi:MAG: hypothetical protein AAF467_11455 [Actinomycetota bacterium]
MSTFRAVKADKPDRLSVTYLVHGVEIDDARDQVSAAIGLELEQRRSSFVGRYFRYRDDDVEFQVKLNWFDDGELVHPDVPEGVFINYTCLPPDPFQVQLDELPFLERYRAVVWGRKDGESFRREVD